MTAGRDDGDKSDGRLPDTVRQQLNRDARSRGTGAGPHKRPRWLTFFTVLMFLTGARLFLGSLDDLYRLVTRKPEVLNLESNRDPQQVAVLRAQVVFDNELSRSRPGVLALQAVVRLVLGLVYLLAVAAVLAKDVRGRRVCLVAGWLGLAASAGDAIFLSLWVSKSLPGLLPRLAEAFAQDAVRFGRPEPTGELVAEQARLFLVDGPLAMCGMGMVLNLVVLAYFAGRRMRGFYEQLGQVHG